MEIEEPKRSINTEIGVFVEAKQSELIEKKGDKFVNNSNKIRYIVKDIINTYPISASNDLILYLEYLKSVGQATITQGKDDLIIRIKKEDIKNKRINAPETISRIRRELFSQGEIDYDEETKANRKNQEEEIKNYYSNLK